MNKQSNLYTVIYSIVLVTVVAAALAFVSVSLKPIQQQNVEIEKKSDILGSVGLYNPENIKGDKDAYINELYSKFITESFLVNSKGEKCGDAAEAFKVLNNLKAVYAKPQAERELPVFISKNESGKINYIFPVYGTGLWGPVWGYIAVDADLNTINGAVFDHKSETPGLGAEIASDGFEGQFTNETKTLFEGGKFVGIVVTKGVGSSKGNPHAVDAVSGGTITSRAVETMIVTCLADYVPYINKTK
ncbi:MAG: NADH:ubiquinone reductase (Na(+)-transporting) subunit C [Rikenellaceae bacterium]